MQFNEVVQKELDTLVESGRFTEIIRGQLEKTITEIAKDTLREYGDFGKRIKEAVQSSLNIDLERVKVLDYNSIVTTIFNEQIQMFALEKIQEPVKRMIDGYSGMLEKKVWKLSEVVDEFIKVVTEGKRDTSSCGEITLIVEESSYGSRYIYLDEDEDVDAHKCEYKLWIDSKDGELFSFEAGKYRPYGPDIRRQPIPNYGFAGFLFKLYASQSTITSINKYECSTEWDTSID